MKNSSTVAALNRRLRVMQRFVDFGMIWAKRLSRYGHALERQPVSGDDSRHQAERLVGIYFAAAKIGKLCRRLSGYIKNPAPVGARRVCVGPPPTSPSIPLVETPFMVATHAFKASRLRDHDGCVAMAGRFSDKIRTMIDRDRVLRFGTSDSGSPQGAGPMQANRAVLPKPASPSKPAQLTADVSASQPGLKIVNSDNSLRANTVQSLFNGCAQSALLTRSPP